MASDVETCMHFGESDDDDEFFCSSDGGLNNELSDQLGVDSTILELYKQHQKVNCLKKRLASSLLCDFSKIKSKKVRDDSMKKSEICHFSLKYFDDVIHSMSADQISIIEAYGFGSLLKFQKSSVPKKFVKWIASIVDVRTSEIIFKDRAIPFSKQSVHKILGLPVGGEVLCCDSEAGKSFLMSKFKLEDLRTIKYYGDRLISNEQMSDDEVFLCFMVVAIGCFLYPDSTFVPRTDFMKVFEHPLQVRAYDWSLLIYDLVLKYVVKLSKQLGRPKRGSHVLSAASYVLAVLYLDCLNFGSYKISQDIPRISFWNGSVIKYCSELDQISSSEFGRRPLKLLIDTTYDQSFLKIDQSIANGMFDSSVPSEFKAKLESLYGDILPDELKYGICNIYANHFSEESKRMNLSCQALIFKIFSFCNELSAKVKDGSTDGEDAITCAVPDQFNFLSEHVHETPNIGNDVHEAKCDDVDQDLGLCLNFGLNVNPSICNGDLPCAKKSRLVSDVADTKQQDVDSLVHNDVVEYQKVCDLSTPAFIMNKNLSSSAPSLLIGDAPVVKQKKHSKGQVIGTKPSLFDLNSRAYEFRPENYITPDDHVIEVDTVKKLAELEEVFGCGLCDTPERPNVVADGSKYVFDVETQQYVIFRNDVHKEKFLSKNAGFLSKLQIGDLNMPFQQNEEVSANKTCSRQVNVNHGPDSFPHAPHDKSCLHLGSKEPIGAQKNIVCLADSDEEIKLAMHASKPVPVINLDEEEEKNGHDANDVKFIGEVKFRNKITDMCNQSDILYNKTLLPGANCLNGACAGPSNVQNADNASKSTVPVFERPAVCRPIAWSTKFVVSDKERRNYLAACRLASSTKWKEQNAVEIGGCFVKYRELGNSLRTGSKVGSFVINALCRKFFLEKRPTISRKHYFFSSVGAILLKGSGSISYVQKCFDGAASLFFPICHDDHWFLFIVDIKNTLFVFLDSYYSEDDDYHVFVRSNLIPSFKKIWSDLVEGPLDFENFDIAYPPVPKQNNLVDCGVFVIMFLTYWTWYCGLCIEFTQKDIDNIRIHTLSDLVCSKHNVAYATPITNYFGPSCGEGLSVFTFSELVWQKGLATATLSLYFLLHPPYCLILLVVYEAPSVAISDAIFDKALNIRICDGADKNVRA
ncbi:hypothetical protein ACP70R_026992 [Stipagrostis hirtigluma subsp. patula]